MTTSTRRRGLASAAAASLLTITVAACGGSGGNSGDSGDSGDSPGGGSAAFREQPAEAAAHLDQAGPADNLSANGEAASTAREPTGGAQGGQGVLQQSVISTGNVAMKSDDVGRAIFDVRKVVDVHRGEVEEDTTETDDDGDPLRSRMVLRIPADRFGDAMEKLEDVATLITSSSNSKDVTTAVIDKQVRIQVQKRSIARIAVLLDRATSIRDIVNIEAELSRRQATLASLERQQRYLADQTSMSTITVSVERTREKEPGTEEKKRETGFLAGLAAGWDGLTTFGVGLATVIGALLPWTILLALIAIPGWPLLRRLRRREAPAAAT
jgi:hypothetical protein